MEQWRPPSLALQGQEYPPFGSILQAVSLLWGCDCDQTASLLFVSEVSYFSIILNSAAGGKLPCSPCQVPFQPSWQQVSPEGSSFGLQHFEIQLIRGAAYFSPSTAFNGSWFWLKQEGLYSSALAGTWKLLKPILSQRKWHQFGQI